MLSFCNTPQLEIYFEYNHTSVRIFTFAWYNLFHPFFPSSLAGKLCHLWFNSVLVVCTISYIEFLSFVVSTLMLISSSDIHFSVILLFSARFSIASFRRCQISPETLFTNPFYSYSFINSYIWHNPFHVLLCWF